MWRRIVTWTCKNILVYSWNFLDNIMLHSKTFDHRLYKRCQVWIWTLRPHPVTFLSTSSALLCSQIGVVETSASHITYMTDLESRWGLGTVILHAADRAETSGCACLVISFKILRFLTFLACKYEIQDMYLCHASGCALWNTTSMSRRKAWIVWSKSILARRVLHAKNPGHS